MKPLIGITSSMEVDGTYYLVTNDNMRAISQAEGIPVLLPYLYNDEDITQITYHIDGLYLTGGYDIDPTLFGEEPHPKLGTIIPERDTFELKIIKKMLSLNKPILGVCRGCQILNIAAGGNMYQDIYAQSKQELLQHQQQAPASHGSHFVDVVVGSKLHQFTGRKKLRVNSRHHQANRDVNYPFQVSGRASDGIIEAIESTEHRFVLGVQWHPENMAIDNDESSIKLLQHFINACKKNM